MTSFQEFLHKKAEEQNQGSRRERRDEWIAAVQRLVDRIIGWLREADPERLLDITPQTIEKSEVGLGSYRISGLRIAVGDLAVRVVPVARNLANPSGLMAGEILAGRVDITDGIKKYVLRRTLRDNEEFWEVINEQYESTPFDQSRLEQILRDLFA